MNSIPSGLIKAVYHSLAHSLWQGMLLALLTAIIIGTTRKAAPAKRYNLLLGTLLLFILGSTFTFIYQLQDISHYRVSISVTHGSDLSFAAWMQQLTDRMMAWPYVGQFTYWLNTHAGLIVLVWLSVICLRMLQLALGLNRMRSLRRSAADAVPAEWKHYVQQTAQTLGIHRGVQLAISGLTKVPLTLGYFKPLILVPAGLLARVSPADLEAILAHELAHIRRRDYLVNLLQHIVETVYFFNPAVWWISSLLRAEREHCCDDVAIALTQNKKQYLQALVACEEYAIATPAYALSFAGRGHQLKDRVLRLVSGYNRKGNRAEKAILSMCLCTLILAATALYSYTYKPLPASGTPAATASNIIPPALPGLATEADVCPPPPAKTTSKEAHAETAVANNMTLSTAAVSGTAAKDTNPVETVVVEMEKDGLVAVNAPNVQVRISNNVVVVNGITIGADLSRKYQDHYVALSGTEGDWQVNYERETTN
ncbi:M56 family metallopeptidase [Edaphocola aurantiacus]|uniref:M56 family metallopeptidase n=1 Tax=Edaphocola aurantiacus TaxID=2601682 RepID=UPI001C987666|nr:M56 family metallopeptidase [Edaphocola aurantiacus]